MSEVDKAAQGSGALVPASPVASAEPVPTAAPVPAMQPGLAAATKAPAKPMNAIQIVEQEISNFQNQRVQAIANVHAVDGAIQAAQHLLARLRAEAAKAVAEAQKLLGEAGADVAKAADAVAVEAGKVVEFAKKEL